MSSLLRPVSPEKSKAMQHKSVVFGPGCIVEPTAPRLIEFFKKRQSQFLDRHLDEKVQTLDQYLESIDRKNYLSNAPTKSAVTKFCGRIQFENVVLPVTAPKNLVCEECEKCFSVFFCLECNQVFCAKCAGLTHPKGYPGDVLHEHEQRGWVRTG